MREAGYLFIVGFQSQEEPGGEMTAARLAAHAQFVVDLLMRAREQW